MSNANTIAREQLLSIVERIERVQTEIDALNEDKSEIYKEAKGNGFHPKTIRKIVKIRAADPIQKEEEDALLDLYLHALGMAPEGLVRARVESIEEFRSAAATEADLQPPKPADLSSLAGGETDEARQTYSTQPAAFPCEPDGAQGKHASDPEGAKMEVVTSDLQAESRDSGECVDGKSEEAVTSLAEGHPEPSKGVSSQTSRSANAPGTSSTKGKPSRLPIPKSDPNRFGGFVRREGNA